MTKNKQLGLVSFGLFALLVGSRIFFEEKSKKIRGGSSEETIAYSFDPRGLEKVDQSNRKRESENFRNRLHRGASATLSWPGLLALERSFVWLQVLQSVHNESSYEGSFSWLFSKLHFLILNTPKNSHPSFLALSPFFFFTYKDGPGSTYVMNSMIDIAPHAWRAWFWSGYHALENLKDAKLAGDLYRHAAVMPGSPTYLGPLSYRLSHQELFQKMPNPKGIIEKELPEELLQKIRQLRPGWVK